MSNYTQRLANGRVLYGPTEEAVRRAASYLDANGIGTNAQLNAAIDAMTLAQIKTAIKWLFDIQDV